MENKYRSPMSTAYRKPIVINADDPRVNSKKNLKKYQSKIGAEIIVKKQKNDFIQLDDYE